MEKRPDGLWLFSRREFCETRFSYRAGEHVVFGGPSQRGKTSLGFDLIEHICTPDFPVYVAVSKPDDKVTRVRSEELGLRRVKEWPPPNGIKELFSSKPNGYVIWPEFGDIETDAETTGQVLGNLLADRYSAGAKGKGRGILMLHDTWTKARIQRLDRKMMTISAMAGAMGLGGWTEVQKPQGAGETVRMSYTNCTHAFIGTDRVKSNQIYYNDIGGFEGKFVQNTVASLQMYQFLYLNSDAGYACIVDAGERKITR